MRIAMAALMLAVPAALGTDVTIQDFNYTPSDLTVVVGTTVRWTNLDSMEHTVTSQTGPGTLIPSGVFDSGLFSLGHFYEFTFTQVGVYYYYCVPHGSSMQAVVRVVGAPACYANCDGSSGSPLLTGNDFACFLNRYASGESTANCDGSTGVPSLTANDFACFLNAYASGCS